MGYEKIKPCPFCGSDRIDVRTDDEGISWYMFCSDCGASCKYAVSEEFEMLEVVKAWNRRAEQRQEQKPGKWIVDRYCSECEWDKQEASYTSGWRENYCPNCGADMRGVERMTRQVIHCKECKHYQPFVKNKPFDCDSGMSGVKENDFCSFAEQIESEE